MAYDDEGTPCSGALGGGSPRVRQITQQRVERCGRAGQYGQAFFDKIWFHGLSVLLPNTQISVTDQGFHLIPHRFEYRIGGGQITPRRPTWTRAEPRRCCARTRSTAPDARVDLREAASARPASSCLFRTVSPASADRCRKVP